jgi:hypothetical protein
MDFLHHGQDQGAKSMLEEMVSQQKRRTSLHSVVAYSGIRAFADDMRLERDKSLCRGTVVALKEVLGHKRHSDQVEAPNHKDSDQEQLAHPAESRRRSRRIHVCRLRQLLVLFIHDEARDGGDEVAEKEVVEA